MHESITHFLFPAHTIDKKPVEKNEDKMMQLPSPQFNVMGLTHAQLQSLMMLANERMATIGAAAPAPAPAPAPSWRQRVLHHGRAPVAAPVLVPSPALVTAPSTPTTNAGNSDGSERSQRHHDKDDVTKLASYICKNYMKGEKLWRFLYEGYSYMDNHNLLHVLKDIHSNSPLKKKQKILLKDQLDNNQKQFFRMIKRRVASAKKYRKTCKKNKKKWKPSPMVDTIDLTLSVHSEDSDSESSSSDSDSEGANADSEGKGRVTTPETRKGVNAGGKGKGKGKGANAGDKGEAKGVNAGGKGKDKGRGKGVNAGGKGRGKGTNAGNKSEDKGVDPAAVRRTNAKNFLKKMQDRRETNQKGKTSKRKKQISRKARGLSPKQSSDEEEDDAYRTPTTNTRRKRKSTGRANTRRTRKRVDTTPTFKIGDKVSAQWLGKQNHGDWFPGSICDINEKKQTMHIEYDDGDEDTSVPWASVIIPESKFVCVHEEI